jgi:hypothetical protein
MNLNVKPIKERRTEPPEQSVLWQQLSLAQKFSASSLGKFGYELTFIRREGGFSIAVLTCDDDIAVVYDDGDIETSAEIKIR